MSRTLGVSNVEDKLIRVLRRTLGGKNEIHSRSDKDRRFENNTERADPHPTGRATGRAKLSLLHNHDERRTFHRRILGRHFPEPVGFVLAIQPTLILPRQKHQILVVRQSAFSRGVFKLLG